MRLEWKPDETPPNGQDENSQNKNNQNKNGQAQNSQNDQPADGNMKNNQKAPPGSDETYMAPVTDMSGAHERVLHPMQGMNFQQKVKYLLTYYGLKTLATVSLIAVIIALIVNYVTHREAAVRFILMNHVIETEEQAEDLKATMDDYLVENGYDEKDFVEINSEVRYSTNDKNTDFLDVQSLMTLIATKKYSGFFADEYMFTYYGNSEYYRDVTLLLTDEQFKAFEESGDIIYGHKYEDGSIYPCGIRLSADNCNWLKHTSYKTCCYGVLFGEMTDEEAYTLTQYILNYDK